MTMKTTILHCVSNRLSFAVAGSWLLASTCCFPACAQIVFTAADLPSHAGDYYRAYVNTAGIDVSALVGQPGGPRRWDFSGTAGPNDALRRMEVVPPSDGGQGSSFPDAAYAERLTTEATGVQSWSYYRIVTNEGRRYYGFFDAVANPAQPVTVFNAPTTDLPDRIGYGTNWNRTVDWLDLIDAGFFQLQVAVHFTSQAQADAYGTVVLPGIGEVPALRVNEVNTYEVTDLSLGIPLSTEYFRNYYWLVRGVGKAVHIISNGATTVPPANFTTAKTVLRVFAASNVTDGPSLRPVAALRIRAQPQMAILDWLSETNRSGYRVESLDFLGGTNWQVLAEPSGNSWSNALLPAATQRFYRVFSKP
jgi:hypothetical protein